MKSVAKKRVRLPDIGEELFERYPSMSAQTHEAAVKGYARMAISDAEARIRELELENERLAKAHETIMIMRDEPDKGLWRYWSAKAKEVAGKLAEAEAAEALLKEAMEALEPFAEEAEAWDGYDDSEALIEEFPTYCGRNIRVGQLRAARALLERKP